MNIYKTLNNLGVDEHQDKKHQKKVRINNLICILWYHALILTSIIPVLVRDDFGFFLTYNFCGLLIIIVCQLLNKKGYTLASSFALTIFSSIHYLVISCFIAPGRYVEFFYLVIPSATLTIFNKTWQSLLILFLCIILFHIPFYCFDFYTSESTLLLPPLMIFLFVTVFSIVLYFKIQNEKNEELLQKDKSLIEIQKKELEELNNFKNKFFVNISHELRTPLTIIDGIASQAVHHKEEVFEHDIKQILGQSKKMKEIVDQILDLSKMRLNKLELNLKKVNATELLQKLHSSFLPSFQEKGIDFLLNISSEEVFVNADVMYLERAVSNLIVNSLKYTNTGKVIISLQCINDEAIINIDDTGIGIKKDEIQNVFQEFYQVDNEINSAGGSGVGLTFVKNIINLQGGDLQIESDLGEGAKAIVKLNAIATDVKTVEISQPINVNPESTSTNTKYDNSNRPTILIVEDHSEMLLFLKSLLSNKYYIKDAKNGQEGLKMLATHKIDFILTDYMMPHMNGEEFIKELRLQGKDTPVIMLTARTDLKTKLDVLRLGIDDYLHKPFNSDELLIKIENRLKNFSEAIKESSEDNAIFQTSEFIKDLSNYIDENCHDFNFKIDNLCIHFGYSESSLFRKVKSQTGFSPKGLIKEVRFLKARKKLEEKKVTSLKELVFSVGIKNSSYFKKQYFERFGTSISDSL